MDTRKLEILKNDKTILLSLAEPGQGGDVIAHIEAATVHKVPLREVRRRWNGYHDLVRRLDNILVELEDTNHATIATIQEGRRALIDQGWNDTTLGELADHNEAKD